VNALHAKNAVETIRYGMELVDSGGADRNKNDHE
jgi:hypothetical protein